MTYSYLKQHPETVKSKHDDHLFSRIHREIAYLSAKDLSPDWSHTPSSAFPVSFKLLARANEKRSPEPRGYSYHAENQHVHLEEFDMTLSAPRNQERYLSVDVQCQLHFIVLTHAQEPRYPVGEKDSVCHWGDSSFFLRSNNPHAVFIPIKCFSIGILCGVQMNMCSGGRHRFRSVGRTGWQKSERSNTNHIFHVKKIFE